MTRVLSDIFVYAVSKDGLYLTRPVIGKYFDSHHCDIVFKEYSGLPDLLAGS